MKKHLKRCKTRLKLFYKLEEVASFFMEIFIFKASICQSTALGNIPELSKQQMQSRICDLYANFSMLLRDCYLIPIQSFFLFLEEGSALFKPNVCTFTKIFCTTFFE